MEKQEFIDMVENYDCNLVKIKDVVGLLWDIHAYKVDSLNQYELISKYKTSQTLINTLYDLLLYQDEESKKNIDKIYKK